MSNERPATQDRFRETFLTKNRWWVLLGLLVVLAITWAAVSVGPRLRYGKSLETGWYGNSYEAANSLFAALAFAGVIFTILLQSEELRLQRQEIEQTQEELRRTANAQERSEQALLLSAYLSAYSSLFNSVANSKGEEVRGVASFRFLHSKHDQMLTVLHGVTDQLRTSLPLSWQPGATKSVQRWLSEYAKEYERYIVKCKESGDFRALYTSFQDVARFAAKLCEIVDELEPEGQVLAKLLRDIKQSGGDVEGPDFMTSTPIYNDREKHSKWLAHAKNLVDQMHLAAEVH